jgi:hypothetical protein
MRTRGPPPVLTAASVSVPVRVVMDLAITVNRMPRWLVLVTTLGYSHGSVSCRPRGTVRGTALWIIPAQRVLSVRWARAIGAASALGARGRTSCKRLASGSNPLAGSQFSGSLAVASTLIVGRRRVVTSCCRSTSLPLRLLPGERGRPRRAARRADRLRPGPSDHPALRHRERVRNPALRWPDSSGRCSRLRSGSTAVPHAPNAQTQCWRSVVRRPRQ